MSDIGVHTLENFNIPSKFRKHGKHVCPMCISRQYDFYVIEIHLRGYGEFSRKMLICCTQCIKKQHMLISKYYKILDISTVEHAKKCNFTLTGDYV